MNSLRSGLGVARRLLLSSFGSRLGRLENETPIVSFCFDDFPRTAYLAGGAILKRFGARGTYYAAPGLMNTSNDLGEQFTLSDIESLLSDGHELGCHTFSHMSCRSVPFKAFETDVLKGREALRKMTGRDPVNFAYPFGHVSVVAKKKIGAQMKTCRGIYGGLNGANPDLNLLSANSLYGDVDQVAECESLVSANLQRKAWLIFYTHDVRDNPSPFGCTPALLEKVVSLTLARGFQVAPVQEVVGSIDPVQGGTMRKRKHGSPAEIS
jgi:peptidoglycan/xylan/chitin deacetylase (PgdA/CDA1 family)